MLLPRSSAAERWPYKPCVAGSTPAGGTKEDNNHVIFFFYVSGGSELNVIQLIINLFFLAIPNESLVESLKHPNYHIRNYSHNILSKRYPQPYPEIIDGYSHNDPEIRNRCRLLLFEYYHKDIENYTVEAEYAFSYFPCIDALWWDEVERTYVHPGSVSNLIPLANYAYDNWGHPEQRMMVKPWFPPPNVKTTAYADYRGSTQIMVANLMYRKWPQWFIRCIVNEMRRRDEVFLNPPPKG